MILAAFALLFVTFRAFKKARTSFHPSEPDTAVITDGPYRFTRNPIYLALSVLTAGLALTMVPTAWLSPLASL